MAKITFPGLRDYELMLSKIEGLTDDMIGRAVYEGAGIVADAVKANIEALPIVTGYGTSENPLPGGVTAAQKAGLREGFGISKLQDDSGYLNVKLGFDGYNRTKTEKYPGGQPNQLVARGVESGTSWKQKKSFIRPAVNKTRKQAEQKMKDVLDEEISKIAE